MPTKLLMRLSPLVLLILPFFFPDEYIIFPGNKEFSIGAFNDERTNGNSEVIALTTGKDLVRFRFRLDNQYPYPYVGCVFNCIHGVKNLAGYDTLKIKLKTDINSIRINFHYQLADFTRPGDDATHLMTEGWIKPLKQKDEYTLKFRDFKVPQWWYEFHRLSVSYADRIDYTAFRGIELTVTDVTITGQEKFIEISALSLQYNKATIFLVVGLIIIIIYLSLFLYSTKLGPLLCIRSVTPVLPASRMASWDDLCFQKLNDFLDSAYMDPELTLARVKIKLGLSTRKINQLLKTRTNLTFKKYINQMRLEKARELLRMTEKKITDIAYETGFNNHTHFHRIFKEQEGISPGEFRVLQKKTL